MSKQRKCSYCNEIMPDFNLWKIHLMSKHLEVLKKEKKLNNQIGVAFIPSALIDGAIEGRDAHCKTFF